MAVIRVKRIETKSSPTLLPGEIGVVNTDLYFGRWNAADSALLSATKIANQDASNTFIGLSTFKAAAKTISFQNSAGTEMYNVTDGRLIASRPSGFSFNSNDLVDKAYVDAIAQGLVVHPAAKVASTINIAVLAGLLTIDTITVVVGDRILVKNQTTVSENGIYVASATGWSRATDMDGSWNDEVYGAYVFVDQGSTQSDTSWTTTVGTDGTVGTTAITWTQFSAVGGAVADEDTLTKTGNVFSIKALGVGATELEAAYGDNKNPYATKAAGYVLAAATSGGGIPAFRALVYGDLTGTVPTWNQSTTGEAGSVANSFIIKEGGGTTENTDLYTFDGSGAKTLNFVGGANVTIATTAGQFSFSAVDTTYSLISEAEIDNNASATARLISGERFQYGIGNFNLVSAGETFNFGVGTIATALNKTLNIGTGLMTGSADTVINIGPTVIGSGGSFGTSINDILITSDTKLVGSFYKLGADPSGTTALKYDGNLYATNFYGALVGNASTATVAAKATILETTRAFTIGSTAKNFNGSAAVSWSLAEIGAQAALGYTPINKAGDTMLGALVIGALGTGTESDSLDLTFNGKNLNNPFAKDLYMSNDGELNWGAEIIAMTGDIPTVFTLGNDILDGSITAGSYKRFTAAVSGNLSSDATPAAGASQLTWSGTFSANILEGLVDGGIIWV